jgi:excisionase family DNA binding protein
VAPEPHSAALGELLRVAPALTALEVRQLLGAWERAGAALKARLWEAEAQPPPLPSPPALPDPATEEKLLTPEEAAELLGRSRWWIYKRRHELPHVPLPGGRFAFSRARLERWIRDRAS